MLDHYIVAIAFILGLVSLYWILREIVLCPVKAGENTKLIIRLNINGEAKDLEHTLKGLIWLRDNGTLKADIEIIASEPAVSARLVGEAFSRDYHYIFYNEIGEENGRTFSDKRNNKLRDIQK